MNKLNSSLDQTSSTSPSNGLASGSKTSVLSTTQSNDSFFDSLFGGQPVIGPACFGKLRKTPEMNMSCFLQGNYKLSILFISCGYASQGQVVLIGLRVAEDGFSTFLKRSQDKQQIQEIPYENDTGHRWRMQKNTKYSSKGQ
jgi:hypothetical protein